MGLERRGRADQGQPVASPQGEEPGAGPGPGVKSFETGKRLVYQAWEKVRANNGAPGVDAVSTGPVRTAVEGQPLQAVEQDELGRHFPGPVRGAGGYRRITGRACGCSGCLTRRTGWRRLRRRCCWRGNWSRSSTAAATATVPGAVPLDALAACRRRCWAQDWVLDLDVRAFFDSVPHSLLMKVVAHHTSERWVLLYVSRWLTAPMQMPDGTIVPREKGNPSGIPDFTVAG